MAEKPGPRAVARVVDGVRVAVRVTPRAAHEAVRGPGPGGAAFRVSVTAPPEGGKANEAAIRLLAKAWGVPKSSVTVVAGATARNKTLLVRGEAGALARRIGEWIRTHGES